MTLSRTSLCDRAYTRNLSRGVEVPYARYDILEPQARAILARQIALSRTELANLFQKDFTLTVTSGVCALSTHLTASEPMIGECLKYAKITSADSSYVWQYVPDYMTLTLDRPAFGLIYFTVSGQSLYVTDTDGVVASLDTTATANASCVLLAASLSGNTDLEELAISTLCSLAMGEAKAEAA